MRITDDGSTVYNGLTVNTPFENNADSGVKVDDFLQLMIAQMSNQDFLNPADDTQYVTQLAQFATMQSMQELSYYSQTNYVTGLVGKNVTVASLGLGGNVSKETGMVTSVNLSSDSYSVTVNGKEYELSQIMEVADVNAGVPITDLENANKMSVYGTGTGTNNIGIRWEHPITDKDLQGELTYEVYLTTDEELDFNNISNVKKAKLVGEGIKDTTYNITGLESDTTYFINVVVKNKNGDSAVYQSMEVSTNYDPYVDKETEDTEETG